MLIISNTLIQTSPIVKHPNLSRRILPFGQADLLCCGAFAVYEYSFMRHASHIDP